MKLYYAKGVCSLVPHIINEVGLHAEFESVNLKTKQTETGKDFLTINHKGAVPTLELPNGEILTENSVILQYIADHKKSFHLLPALGDF
ncbi:MAG: glutathione S-transferase N-terminal domain-containing protein [Legionellaceae bacterium]|nr:glutathione S-transferase N-terminal domain-containing protein [Legionellaceae bacterium]